MSGLSPRNLKYMRTFAHAWPDRQIVQRTVAQIPWRSNLALLDKLDRSVTRLWYAQKTIKNGWSRDVLVLQIESNLHLRQGQAVTNFDLALPAADSDLAAQVFKDPYLFDFFGTANPRKEREVEQALVDHMQRFLLEMGAGFAFVGRQVQLEVVSERYSLHHCTWDRGKDQPRANEHGDEPIMLRVGRPFTAQSAISYFALVEGVEQIRSRAVGSVFDSIIRDTFKLIPFLVPGQKFIQMFFDRIVPIIRQIDVLSHEERKLTQDRDLLIPRLMNGEIAV